MISIELVEIEFLKDEFLCSRFHADDVPILWIKNNFNYIVTI